MEGISKVGNPFNSFPEGIAESLGSLLDENDRGGMETPKDIAFGECEHER